MERADACQTEHGRTELTRIGDELYEVWGYLDAAIVRWLGRSNPTSTALVEDLNEMVREA